MANADFNDDPNKRRQSSNPPKAKRGSKANATLRMKTASWGGLAGKTQSKARNSGFGKKTQIYSTQTGL